MTTPIPTQVPPDPNGRVRKTYPLSDLGIAPENMRFGEPPDDDIPQLAETMAAAGVLQPLTVRPGRGKKERPAMALDGRRRILGLELLRDAGRIAPDYPVEVFEETDPARQAAAVLLTNTAVPVHVADVIVSIGKMLKAKLGIDAIAGALGYPPLDVRRLAALSSLHPKAIQALRLGRLTLKQAKLLARLQERTLQAELADYALQGQGFPEWRAIQALDGGEVTTSDARFALVGPERYGAAGGRTSADLFGERPDVLLDPEILQALWTEQVGPLSAGLEKAGLAVVMGNDPHSEPPDDLEPFGYRYGLDLDEAAQIAWRDAQARVQQVALQLTGVDPSSAEGLILLASLLEARIAAAQATEPTRPVTTVILFPSHRGGVDLACFAPAAPEPDVGELSSDALDAASSAPLDQRSGEPLAQAAAPATEGVNHALHEVRTDTATRALIRAIADDPGAALTALIARLFSVLVLRAGVHKGGGALTIGAEAYGRPRAPVIETLDGDVRRRLAERRAQWEGSGRSLIAWVASLPHGEKMATLAELTALTLDLREERTTQLRRQARAEAAELAVLTDADVTLHWTPDEPFLRAHSKVHLLAMLDAMGLEDPRARTLKKEALVAFVAERAAERSWAPAFLSCKAEPAEAEPAEPEVDPPADGTDAGLNQAA